MKLNCKVGFKIKTLSIFLITHVAIYTLGQKHSKVNIKHRLLIKIQFTLETIFDI